MAARILAVTCALFLGIGIIITSGSARGVPHAYCRIVWLIGLPCSQVKMAILTQMKAMGSYKLVSVTPDRIHANHSSAVGQMESVNFTITPTSMALGCHVEGSSVSAFWYSLFDNGTNYCNLRNVIKGSGLTEAPGFVEFTNEWLCLGVGLAACK